MAKKPFTTSFALPLVYLSKKKSLSLSRGTLVEIIASKAVTKAGCSNGSPENVGASFTGRWLTFC